MTLRCGTRDSELSLLQTNDALARLRDETGLDFEVVPFSSPGDRDQATDLRASPGDFFTRDLDEALLAGRIDCALHSAKDLPPGGLPEGLDWFWLPWREDPRDCLVGDAVHPRRVGVRGGHRAVFNAGKRIDSAFRVPEKKFLSGILRHDRAEAVQGVIGVQSSDRINRVGMIGNAVHVFVSTRLEDIGNHRDGGRCAAGRKTRC